MENENNQAVVEETIAPKSSSFQGLYEVMTKPSEFFAYLKDNPKILIPYIFIIGIGIAFFYTIVDMVVEMQLSMPEMQERLQGAPITDQIKTAMRMTTLILGPIALGLTPLIAAALALFWGNFVYGGKANFKQLLSVMLYGEVLFIIGRIIVLPMMLAKGSLLTSLSLGILAAGEGPQSLMYIALSKIDLFIIWEIIVVGIGLSVIYNVPRNKGYVLSVLSIGMLSILQVLFTAVMALF